MIRLPAGAPRVPDKFESYSRAGHFIRHFYFRLRADPDVSPAEDLKFRVVAGLADSNGVSFESVNFPGRFIRQNNDEVLLDLNDSTAAFAQDATFRSVPGLADSSFISFQSSKQPARYLRQLNAQLRIDPIVSDTDKRDATWKQTGADAGPDPAKGDGSGLRGEYYDNPDLRGSPKITRVDYGITHLWGDDSPGPGVPADNFSVRWTGQVQPRFSEAYVFSGYRDDGVRVWIDDRLIIDQWKEGNWAPFASDPVLLTANQRHKIRVEYLELQGQAAV